MNDLKQRQCPNILYPLDHGILKLMPSLGYFFVFPFIEQIPPPDTFPDLWKYLYDIALAIESCHKNNIIHLDIKPSNILYSKSGDVFLCDFESAIEGKEDEDPTVFGTLPYWSPEVCEENEDANDFPRDMWAFGVLIIETVYQTYPFNDDPDPDDKGMNEQYARAIGLLKSIKLFLTEAVTGVWSICSSFKFNSGPQG